MLILAIDSSATVASVALCNGEKLIAEFTTNNGNTHSETLLPMVESLLKISDNILSDIDAFAASSGPGSFTGVRIGTATLKGLAFNSNKPCIEVSTLEALAYNLVMEKGLICPVMNARRSQVYTALFRSDGSTLTRLTDDCPMSIEELDSKLSEYGESVFFCGDGYDITLKALNKTKPVGTAYRLTLQSAYSVAQIALAKIEAGKSIGNDSDFRVHYLRPSQAERELMEKQKIL